MIRGVLDSEDSCVSHDIVGQQFIHGLIYTPCKLSIDDHDASGPSVIQRAQRHGPLKADVVISIMKQLLSAGAFLENRFISHRDLKPDNILVNLIPKVTSSGAVPEGVEVQVSITDFGASYSFDHRADDAWCLKPDEVAEAVGGLGGAPMYLAPEIHLAARRTGKARAANYEKCDAWALGCVFLEMLFPFQVINDIQTFVQNIEPLKNPVDETRQQLVDLVIDTLLQQNPEDRSNCGAVLELLQRTFPTPASGR